MADVFVLNTGRAGSRYICRLFHENGFSVGHEITFPLEQACQYDHTQGSHPDPLPSEVDVPDLLQDDRRDEVYLEANHALYSFGCELAELYPEAKFIHLHRDGRDHARSMMCQKHLTIHNGWLPDPDTTPCPPYAWNAPAFLRCVLEWVNRNQVIQEDMASLSQDRVLSVKSEDLWSGKAVPSIEDFLDITLDAKTRDAFGGKKTYTFPAYEDWPTEYRNVFWWLAGDLMLHLGHATHDEVNLHA